MAAARVSEILRERPLLADLANEYQKLKSSGQQVDYRAWIKGKLATPTKDLTAGSAEPNDGTAPHESMPFIALSQFIV